MEFLGSTTNNVTTSLQMCRQLGTLCALCQAHSWAKTLTLMLERLGRLYSLIAEAQLISYSPGQLVLMDDPAFDPNMALPALDFDLPSLQMPDSQCNSSSRSMMSIRGRSGSVNSHTMSAIGIDLPSSSIHGHSYQLPDDPFSASSLRKHEGIGREIFDDEAQIFQDDMLFEFDANGEMRDIGIDERTARLASAINADRLGGFSAASRIIQKEHDDDQDLPIEDSMAEFDLMDSVDVQMLPDADPFPMMVGGLGGSDQPQSQVTDLVYSEENSAVSAEAAQTRRKPKAPKMLEIDRVTELLNADLRIWQSEYLNNMMAVSFARMNKTANVQAKNNAMFYVYGSGLNGVGVGIGSSKIPSPLTLFSGESLLSLVTGNPPPSPKHNARKGKKRVQEDDGDAYSPKRARHSDPDQEPEHELARMVEDNGEFIMDDGTEIGRDAAEAIDDYHSSAIMPWNISQSLNSYQRGVVSSLSGRLPSLGSYRLTSASPLIGRGAPLPSNMDHLDMTDLDQIMYDRDDIVSLDEDAALRSGASQGLHMTSSQVEAEEFEIYGPAAQVDTQTAAASQWVREVLNLESRNFFDYVSNSISEKYPDDLALRDPNDEDLIEDDKHVTFEELFDPNTNSKIVAAQAFYHVLSLATKNRVWVAQDVEKGIFEPFGEIHIGILSA